MNDELSQRYQKNCKLGEGTYGVVFKAYDTKTKQNVALKIMKNNQEDEGLSPITLREVSILHTINHPNIVKLLDFTADENNITLVFEYLHSDLRKYLKIINEKKKGPLDPGLLRSYAFQLLAAIYVLHTNRIMHRDLKPENLLLNREGHLKLADFGLARYFTVPMRQYSPEIVSTWYRAPELLFSPKSYDLSVDIWSAGCIIAEMARGEILFLADSEIDLIHKILNVLGTPSQENLADLPQDIRDEMPQYQPKPIEEVLKTNDLFLADLVAKMLVYDPIKRISAIEALQHPYFNELSQAVRRMSLPDNLL